MNIDYEAVGMKVRFYRLQAKMSQETLAEFADVSRVYISGIERGEKPPSLDTIVCLANALQVSVDELLSGSLINGGNGKTYSDPFLDCTPDELSILLAAVESLKGILRNYKITE